MLLASGPYQYFYGVRITVCCLHRLIDLIKSVCMCDKRFDIDLVLQYRPECLRHPDMPLHCTVMD